MENRKMYAIIFFLMFAAVFSGCFQDIGSSSIGGVSDFESCVAAGNPVMESYPRQCRDASGRTFTETDGNVGEACLAHDECRTPFSYLAQSNCPFGSACIDSTCKVVCPLIDGSGRPGEYHTAEVACNEDADCDCSERQQRTIECRCVDNRCLSVEAE